MFSVDELINRFIAWSRSVRGRWILTGLGFVAAMAVVAIPLVTRSTGGVAPQPAANSGISIPMPTTPVLVPSTTPDTFSPIGDRRIGPPLTEATPTTTAPAPKPTFPSTAASSAPATASATSPATSPATTPATTPPPPPTTPPTLPAPPASTGPPDTGVVVPYSP